MPFIFRRHHSHSGSSKQSNARPSLGTLGTGKEISESLAPRREGESMSSSDGVPVEFRKVPAGDESRLWQTKRIRHADLNRLQLRTVEAALDPTVSADSIIGAVAYAVTSHGLRVTQRELGRIVAQRVEAPYLASVSSGSWRSGSGQEREEWRMVVATLGVSKGGGGGTVAERVLSVSFVTDPVPKPTDLAGKSAAAMASLMGSVGSAASTISSTISSGSSNGSGGGGGSFTAKRLSREGATVTTGASLSAVEIANARSNQRADSLLQAVVAELGRIGWDADEKTDSGATCRVVQGEAEKSQTVSPGQQQEGVAEKGKDSSFGIAPEEESARSAQWYEDVKLAPFEGGGASDTMRMSNGAAATAAAALNSLSPEVGKGDVAEDQEQEGCLEAGEAPSNRDGAPAAEESDATNALTEVRLCLQFVEGLCARAEEYSRRDASETWKPLQETVYRLEGDIAALRKLLEPKYRAIGAVPPPVPTWAGRASLGDGDGSRLEQAAPIAAGSGPSGRVVALLRSSPLFVIEGRSVKARVVVAQKPIKAGSANAGEEPEGRDDGAAAGAGSSSTGRGRSAGNDRHRHAALVRAAIQALTGVISRACEGQEEVFLKARLPGAQAYTVELERYRSEIVRGVAIRTGVAHPSPLGGVRGRGNARMRSAEVDDDLWRLFAARETRLYSSSAALGKKPGRIYVTYDTLWFHSKVLGFEYRHVLRLADVCSITLLGTALDLSSSLVIATNDGGGVPGELMLVFPGQKVRQVKPLEVLLRQLAVIAVQERKAAAAAAREATGVLAGAGAEAETSDEPPQDGEKDSATLVGVCV